MRMPELMRSFLTSSACEVRSVASQGAAESGLLPEWNLTDLYPGMDSAEFASDIGRALSESKAFAADYRGKLADLASGTEASATRFFSPPERR